MISFHTAVMEGSSVYMCFPCYQEFNTLEEVLKHQLTCTAEEDQSGSSGSTAVAIPVDQPQVTNSFLSQEQKQICCCGPLGDQMKASEEHAANNTELTSTSLVIDKQ